MSGWTIAPAVAFAAAVMMAAAFGPAAAASPAPVAIQPVDYLVGGWELYRSRFVTEEGRVVDDDNGSISHSEGQGYGMLLAVAAGDRASFETLWNWTDQELFIRKDGLAAWRWTPEAQPRVTDTNDATDGDLLIAWALLRAAEKWNVPEWRVAAAKIADALARLAVKTVGGHRVLMPAVAGFDAGEQPDGPVVNLSYWIFPAIDELSTISPALAKAKLSESGLRLARAARFGESGLPSDWISLAAKTPAPARSFPATFGWNAVRIPLYIAWGPRDQRDLLDAYRESWGDGGPKVVDLSSGVVLDPLPAPGYAAIKDLVACSLDGRRVSDATRNFEPTTYYPSTLHLLSLLVLAERYPRCL
jgi:endoglucanase